MANRTLYSSKPPGSRRKGQEPASTSLPRPSFSHHPSAGTSSSVAPQKFPQGLVTRSNEASSGKPTQVQIVKATKVDITSKRASREGSDLKKTASGIPKGLAGGMGTRTEIAAGLLQSQGPRTLRRKAVLPEQPRINPRAEDETAREAPQKFVISSPSEQKVDYTGSIFGITLPPNANLEVQEYAPTEFATSQSRMEYYMSKQLPHKLSTQNLPPPTPNFTGKDSSTSSRLTDTPSPYSRISTPNTSLSSYSPGVVQVAKGISPKPLSSPSRNRPPVVRRRLPGSTPVEESSSFNGLPSVREASVNSSSSSAATVKVTNSIDQKTGRSAPAYQNDGLPTRTSSKRLPGPSEQALEDPATASSSSTVAPQYRPSRLPTRAAPTRPARNSTPVLEANPPTVVQSNMSHIATTGHKRRESIERALLNPQAERTSTESPRRKLTKTPPNSQTVTDLPRPATITSPHLYPTGSSNRLRQPPAIVTDIPKAYKRDPSPASATSARSNARLGLFTRRIKSPQEADRLLKKGPAAGTGHEGYGKYARRGRTTSISSNASRGMSSSSERSPSIPARAPNSRASSFGSTDGGRPVLDDFFKDRLEPVVISGGNVVRGHRDSGNGIYQSSSAQTSSASIGSSLAYSKDSTHQSSNSGLSMFSNNRTSRELLPGPRLATAGALGLPKIPTLAHRRSFNRVSQGEPNIFSVPAPIDTLAAAPRPSFDSRETAISSAPFSEGLSTNADFSEEREGNWLKSSKPRTKSPSKWNFFRRARSPKKALPAEPQEQSYEPDQVSVAINGAVRPDYSGHYGMMDDDNSSEKSLDDILRDIEDNLELRDDDGAIIVSEAEQRERQVSMLLPSPPKFYPEFDPYQPSRPPNGNHYDPISFDAPGLGLMRTGSRLQRVGHIPPVSASPEHVYRPGQQSFSRPFTPRNVIEIDLPATSTVRDFSIPATPDVRSLPIKRNVPVTWMGEKYSERWQQTSSPPAVNNTTRYLPGREIEFLTYPIEMQSSEASSSTGNTSFVNTMLAMGPPISTPPHEEIWNEYDDLVDDVDMPFPLGSGEGQEILNSFPSLSNIRQPSPPKSDSPRQASRQSYRSTAKSPPLPERPDYLRLPPHMHPDTTSKVSLGEIYADYNRSSMGGGPDNRASTASGSRYSKSTTISTSSVCSETSHSDAAVNVVTPLLRADDQPLALVRSRALLPSR